MTTVGDLFDPRPGRWGLRGDPYLWDELAQALADVRLPRRKRDLWRVLTTAFREATGHSLNACEMVRIDRFDTGGMSGGMISGEFWRETAIPLIVGRYDMLNSGIPPQA